MTDHTNLSAISLLSGLSKCYDVPGLIVSETAVLRAKTSSSIRREFNTDKWGELSRVVGARPELGLSDLESIEDGTKPQLLFLNGFTYMAPPDYLRRYVVRELKSALATLLSQNSINAILELGIGYGSKLINLYSQTDGFESYELDFYGLDISECGLGLAKHFASCAGFTLHTIQQDLRSNKKIELSQYSCCLVISSFGLHYLDHFGPDTILGWVTSGITCGVHYEPLTDRYSSISDSIYAAFAMKYYTQQDYTTNIGTAFELLKKQGIISLSISPVACGFGLLPGWLIVWSLADE